MSAPRVTLLDGPLGTELVARGVSLSPPLWSAQALSIAPEVIRRIHEDYARAGARVHTTCTFRTQPRHAGAAWRALLHDAVVLTRDAVPSDHAVAGSLAPLEDCYSPQNSPANCRDEHRQMAEALAEEDVDVILCETFPHEQEALVAVEEAVRTGKPTWLALTAGPEGTLLSPETLRNTAKAARDRGATMLLVNCVAATKTQAYVEALADLGTPFGAYANAGRFDEGLGWGAASDGAPAYLRFALEWIRCGATLVGGCCGTGPLHIAALARALGERELAEGG